MSRPNDPTASVVHITRLHHAFGPTPVLDGVEVTVGHGELLAILGPSGCGKSTLLRAIAGLVLPRRGSVHVDGTLVADEGVEFVPAERRRVGLVFQDYALFPALDVAQNVAFGLRPPDPARVAALLELVGLSTLARRHPGQLSGGQQQRVALARALAPRPSVLLLDEPFANVDAAMRLGIGEELRRIVRAEGAAAILVTHDRTEALAMADRVAVMLTTPSGGRLAQVGSPEEVYRHPMSPDVARLTGDLWTVSGVAAGGVVRCGALHIAAQAEGPVWIGVRPEQATLRADPAGPARVVARSFLGSRWRTTVVQDDVTATIESPDSLPDHGWIEVKACMCWPR